MEVRGDIRRSDLFIGTFLLHSGRTSLWFLSAVTGGMMTFMAWQLGTVRVGPLATAIIAMTIFIPATIAVQVFSMVLTSSYLALRPQKIRGFLGPRVFRIENSGLTVESNFSSIRVSWSGIVNVKRSWFGVIIELPGTSAFFLPRRYFRDPEQLNQFAASMLHGIRTPRTDRLTP